MNERIMVLRGATFVRPIQFDGPCALSARAINYICTKLLSLLLSVYPLCGPIEKHVSKIKNSSILKR